MWGENSCFLLQAHFDELFLTCIKILLFLFFSQMYVHHGIHELIFNFVGTLEASQVGLSSDLLIRPNEGANNPSVHPLSSTSRSWAICILIRFLLTCFLHKRTHRCGVYAACCCRYNVKHTVCRDHLSLQRDRCFSDGSLITALNISPSCSLLL